MEIFTTESNKKQFSLVLIVVAVLLAVFLGVQIIKTLKEYRYVGRTANQLNTVSVTGTGEVNAVPDTGSFSFSVTEEAKTTKEAGDKATAKMNMILSALKDFGVAEKDIKTIGYNVYPKYEYQTRTVACVNGYCPPGKSVISGYEVSQSISVKVRKTADAGTLLSKVGGLGASNVSGLDFVIDNPEALKAEARNKAIADAKAKAAELSKALGVTLDTIVSFNESGDRGPVYYAYGGVANQSKSMDSYAAPEVPVGENKISSTVTITYEIR